MAKTDKSTPPAYISYSALIAFFNALRDTHVPAQIDRSIMSKMSGSQASAMMTSLRFLGLTDYNGKPTPPMKPLVNAADADRGPLLKKVIENAYNFLLDNGDFELETATGQLVADKFREQGLSGSTLTKAMLFFLAAAKEAGIKVSPHIKPPMVPRTETKRSRKRGDEDYEPDEEADDESVDLDMVRFEVPIPGKQSAVVRVPRDLTGDDWDMLSKMLDLYIKRLQAQAG